MESFGEIPKGFFICHTCDNRKCSNPKHLFLGTHEDNMRDKVKKGRQALSRGEDNPMSKLTNENIKKIRYLIEKGIKSIAIELEFSVTRKTVYNIKKRRNWKYI